MEIALSLKGIRATCLPTSNYSALKEAVDVTIKRIWKDWDVDHYPLFLYYMHIPKSSWEIQKQKFISLLLEHKPIKTYVVGFSGSSVTAGHDNFFNEAFPQIFYNNLVGIFKLAGVEMVVRNQALGNNPCYPYDACVETHMVNFLFYSSLFIQRFFIRYFLAQGDDLDLLAWEQSMNCGRTARPLETFTRSAMRMKKTPTVLYLASGTPFWKASDCENASSWPPYQMGATEKKLLLSTAKESAASSSLMNEMKFLKARSGVMLPNVYAGKLSIFSLHIVFFI